MAKDGHQGIIKGQPSGQKPFVLEEKQLKCPTRSMSPSANGGVHVPKGQSSLAAKLALHHLSQVTALK